MTIQPYTITIPQADIDDLRDRLARTRWIDAADDDGWTYGIDLGYMRELADYWQQHYDWRAHEAALNRPRQHALTPLVVGKRGPGPVRVPGRA